MRRDAIFYQIFKRSPRLLFDLVPNPPTNSNQYRFESVEVKESSFRIDGVFLPPEDAESKIVFFAEVQFQKDEALYHRFFSEVMLYLYRNRLTYEDWYGVLIFASRSLAPPDQVTHRSLLNGAQVQQVYLDELSRDESQPVGIQLIQLTLASESEMVEQAQRLLNRVRTEDSLATEAAADIIEVITTIVVYKFTNLSREEVETMLGINLEDVRVLREAKEEGRQEGRQEVLAAAVPLLFRSGMTLEQIAQQFQITVAEIQQILDDRDP